MSNFTPAWFKKGFFNESLFCDDFLSTHQLLYSNGAFFTPDGRMTDTMPLRCEIFEMMREYVGANLAKKVTNVVDVLKLAAQVEDFPPVTDRIALANGTLYLDQGTRVQRCADRQPAQVQSGIHQQHRQLVRAACPGLCGHRSPCAARPYPQWLAGMTSYKGELGCFAAYVRTRQMPFLCTHVRSD